MIGFNALGQLGRLGNQMFQFAALKGIARHRGYQFCLPPSQNKEEYKDHQLLIPFNMVNTSPLNVQYIDEGRPIVVENGFAFDKNLFNTCPDWVSIQGYFQTEKYFKHIRDELLQDFSFKDEIIEPCNEMIATFDTPPVSLHIRRTDYITNPNHTALDISYYKEALKQFDADREVVVFSDDTKWCYEHPLFSDDRFLIADGNSNYVDMCLMTMCNGHITANSSFSWWGAWLSNSEKIIAPSGWFKGSNNEHLDTKDVIPENWIVI
tara:strand:+ start:312 stop:1106 length:795 start_codon:yes stop_codon:yes gene_type:complete